MEHPGLPAVPEAVHNALDDLEDASESAATHARAREELQPHLEALCEALRPAIASALARTGDANPALGVGLELLGYATARSLCAEALGAEPDGGLVNAIAQLAPEAPDAALDARLQGFIASAYDPEACTPALRYFRVELLRDFHPQVRAAALAAHDPERLDLAADLCARISDTDALLDAFDQARAEADVDAAKMAPGPPRHFSRVHLAFALLILALTAYHYLLR